MVKFSKDLEAQLIPEWKEAFVDYWLLKKHVKRIKFALLAASPSPASADSCYFVHLLLRLCSQPHPSHFLKVRLVAFQSIFAADAPGKSVSMNAFVDDDVDAAGGAEA